MRICLCNELYGDIPFSISKLKQLETMILKNNQLIGSIPSTLSQIPNLKIIDLPWNNLIGETPRLIYWNEVLQYLMKGYDSTSTFRGLVALINIDFNSYMMVMLVSNLKPWETYKSDMSIDLKKHHQYWTVEALRWPTDLFFQRRYGCRAMMLETVAAVPGMVGGLLLHCKSLRSFEQSGGWIKALLEEAENERMHLMTFMEVSQPKWYERALVFSL